jgi:hypothetical protein
MNVDPKSARERAVEAREALNDPQQRDRFASDPERLADAAEGLLRLVAAPNRVDPPERLAPSEDSSCGGWYAAEDLCLQMAIRSTDDAGFNKWSELADAYGTMGRACEELRHTL